MMNKTIEIGLSIERIRKHKGISQRELARLSGLTNSTISRIELNQISPTLATISKIEKALNFKIIYLFDELMKLSNDTCGCDN